MPEILVERRDKVAVVTVHDPERRNALTRDLSAGLVDAVADAEGDKAIHALVITGPPPAFCAGADLTLLGAAREEGLRAPRRVAHDPCAPPAPPYRGERPR